MKRVLSLPSQVASPRLAPSARPLLEPPAPLAHAGQGLYLLGPTSSKVLHETDKINYTTKFSQSGNPLP